MKNKTFWLLAVSSLFAEAGHCDTPAMEAGLVLQTTVAYQDEDKDKEKELSGGRVESSGGGSVFRLDNKTYITGLIGTGRLNGAARDWRLVLRFLLLDYNTDEEHEPEKIFAFEAVHIRTGERVSLDDLFQFEVRAMTDLMRKEISLEDTVLSASGKLTSVARVTLVYPEFDEEDGNVSYTLTADCLFNTTYKYGPVKIQGVTFNLQSLGSVMVTGTGTVMVGEELRDDFVLSLKFSTSAFKGVMVMEDD